MRRLHWPLLLPALPVIVAVAAALLAPWVAPASPTSGNLAARLRPPAWISGGSGTRLLGTDLLGRDLLSRLIWGARISLLIALAATVLGAVVGSLIGLVSGYYRGRIDRVVTKLIDVQLAFPFVLLAIAVIAVAGASIPVLVIVLAIGSWVGHARIIRGLVLSLREHPLQSSASRDPVRHPDPGDLRRQADYHPRIHAVLPRAGRAAAHAVVGLGPARRRGVRSAGVVDVGLSRVGHHGGRARRQPGRRCAARRARSADPVPGPGLTAQTLERRP